MPDEKSAKPRDPNQPFPKDEKKGGSLGATLVKLVFFAAFLAVVGTMVSYSLQIHVWPWAWTSENWQGYVTFSREKAQDVGDEIAKIDWSNLKTKVTDKTKQLWADAPGVAQKIEEKLGGQKSSTGAKPGAPGTPAPTSDVTPEHKAALEAMREGITHYRRSPDDPAELQAAKKKFEEAQGHFEKALKETNDDKQKQDIQQELTDCNKYLEDCRAREKS